MDGVWHCQLYVKYQIYFKENILIIFSDLTFFINDQNIAESIGK